MGIGRSMVRKALLGVKSVLAESTDTGTIE
jgi:hypothetical protein